MAKHQLRGPDGRFIKLVRIELPLKTLKEKRNPSKKAKAKKEDKKVFHDIVILDASGSMAGKEVAAIEGYNNHITNLKANAIKLNLEVYHSLYIFSDGRHGTKFLLEKVKVDQVKSLQEYGYTPQGGTPLYDSYLEVIERFINSSENTSVTGITDGEDMHSSKLSRAVAAVKQAKDKGWIVALIGPKGPYIAKAIKDLGIEESNSLEIENTAKGIERGFMQYSTASTDTLISYSKTGVVKKVGFFQKKK